MGASRAAELFDMSVLVAEEGRESLNDVNRIQPDSYSGALFFLFQEVCVILYLGMPPALAVGEEQWICQWIKVVR